MATEPTSQDPLVRMSFYWVWCAFALGQILGWKAHDQIDGWAIALPFIFAALALFEHWSGRRRF